MNDKSFYTPRLMAWVYSLGIPVGAAALIALRVCFGYDWPFPTDAGLVLILASMLQIVFAEVWPAYPPGLRRQAIYSGVWGSLAGLWLYTRLFHDMGLVVLVAVALPLWPLSHLEVLRLEGRLRSDS